MWPLLVARHSIFRVHNPKAMSDLSNKSLLRAQYLVQLVKIKHCT